MFKAFFSVAWHVIFHACKMKFSQFYVYCLIITKKNWEKWNISIKFYLNKLYLSIFQQEYIYMVKGCRKTNWFPIFLYKWIFLTTWQKRNWKMCYCMFFEFFLFHSTPDNHGNEKRFCILIPLLKEKPNWIGKKYLKHLKFMRVS